MSLTRIFSGGQTGADQAGWRAAKKARLETGGWMPAGFKTEDGPRPEFAMLYGAKSHASASYRDRTIANIRPADLTLIFGYQASPGGKLLHREASHLNHPVVAIRSRLEVSPSVVASLISEWIGNTTVNVAGNRESSNPGIGAWVEAYLDEVFSILKEGF